ncbi:hypothetical protein EDB85DRAFT_2142395 [Lactarius pseudohatsudake]|nr:hypothetical protein EDB85DRAFT_2142395 [Lactarius pseudohatsudake]
MSPGCTPSPSAVEQQGTASSTRTAGPSMIRVAQNGEGPELRHTDAHRAPLDYVSHPQAVIPAAPVADSRPATEEQVPVPARGARGRGVASRWRTEGRGMQERLRVVCNVPALSGPDRASLSRVDWTPAVLKDFLSNSRLLRYHLGFLEVTTNLTLLLYCMEGK